MTRSPLSASPTEKAVGSFDSISIAERIGEEGLDLFAAPSYSQANGDATVEPAAADP